MDAKMKKRLGVTLYIISIGMIILSLCMSCNLSVWKDEVATLRIIKNPFSYFLLANREATPPGHLTILKFFVDLFGGILPDIPYLYIAKMTSVLPFLLLVILSYTKVRKQFDFLTGAVFAFLITTMPKMLGISIEIRQYAWALFFTTVFYIYFFDLFYEKKKSAIWICLLSGVLSTFTHYFGCFAVAFLYLVSLICFIKKRDKKGVIIVMALIIMSCVLFSPWLFIAGNQVVDSASGFWIPAITVVDLPSYLTYFFITDTNKLNVGIFAVVVFYIITIYFMKEEITNARSNRNLYSILGMLTPYFVIIVGIFIGLYLWPVFQARYLFPSLGCFWLAFAVVLGKKSTHKKVFGIILCFLMFVSLLNIYKVTKDELQYSRDIKKMVAFFDELEEGDIILTNDYRYRYCFQIYTDNEVSVWKEENIGEEDIRRYQAQGSRIFYFDTDHGQEEGVSFVKYCDDKNIELSSCGEYGLEYVLSELYYVEE